MENHPFLSPKLVLEFFVREFYFFGKSTLRTHFPRKSLSLTLKKDETACFICQREEYGYFYSHEPALNLVM